MPKDIAKFFPKLTAFGISKSGLKVITSADLEPFPELVRLAFYGNKLAYIESDLFKHNTKLQSISLTDNHVFLIDAEFLNPLTILSYAQIEFKAFKQTCESSGCIGDIKKQLKSKYPTENNSKDIFGSIAYVKNLEASLNEHKMEKTKFSEEMEKSLNECKMQKTEYSEYLEKSLKECKMEKMKHSEDLEKAMKGNQTQKMDFSEYMEKPLKEILQKMKNSEDLKNAMNECQTQTAEFSEDITTENPKSN